MFRAKAYVVSLVFVVAVVMPAFGPSRYDSFPLSTYPMFSGRQTAIADIPHAVALSGDGERRILPPGAVLNDEVVQAFETLRRTIARGPDAAQALCERIAKRAGQPGDVAVQIVTDRYDAVRYFEGDKEPLASTVHASCEVGAP